MAAIIHPSCVGKLFPAEATDLREMVDQLLSARAVRHACPKAIVVPHASYCSSGPIAAAAYACLADEAERIRQVVLLGTCHCIHLGGLLTTTAQAIWTPLGEVPVDSWGVEQALRLPQVSVHDEAHRLDHAIAVQLPMLQRSLREFRVVPFLLAGGEPAEVAEVLELLWGGDETLVVVSTDLSHYLNYDEARRRDRRTAAAIVSLDFEAIGRDEACGHRAIAGLLVAARKHGLQGCQVDIRNSGDTCGGRDCVVGYGAFVFEPVAD